jgi:predicted dehydrogenase
MPVSRDDNEMTSARADGAGVGLIGCGKISAAYLQAPYSALRFVACADQDPVRAATTAAEHGLRAMSVEALLADPDVEVVCDLTVPRAHAEIGLAAFAAGKHVYQEKPLGLDRLEGSSLIDAAEDSGLLLGSAPDTFLGAGLQTCRRVIDEGRIGTPVAAMAHMVSHGPEGWHPDPAFFYQHGAGPLFDMGPYYLTALVALLGPIVRVTAATRGVGGARIVPSGARAGEVLAVEVPTHVAGALVLAGGAVATIVMSFDVWSSQLPRLEVHGTEGSLSLPDPNTFAGPVRLFRPDDGWQDVPTDDFDVHQRGIGMADLVEAARAGRSPRASGRLAYHVLDAMVALGESSEHGRHIEIESTTDRPEAMPSRAT